LTKNESERIGGYWSESSRPLVSMLFVLPMLVCYEAGLLVLGPEAMRNGAEAWLRKFLDLIGFGQYLLLPILTCGLLLAWHHVRHERWRFRWSVFYGMLLECLVFGFLLLLFARLQGRLLGSFSFATICAVQLPETVKANAGQIAGYFGAGIYEELMFRLMLMPCIAGLVRLAKLSQRSSWIVAVIVSSLIFSAAHYQIFTAAGDAFNLTSFLFRFLAGVFFAALFLYRGFGIAAGSHAFYDILVAIR
jgi:membrane protease YdiL (CAAX protease family)